MPTDRYDIVARAERPNEPQDQEHLEPALLALLADRFKLEIHRETREIDAIVVRAPRIPKGVKVAGADERNSIRPDGHGNFVFMAVPIRGLTSYLSNTLGGAVVDQTDLKQRYDFVLNTSVTEHPQGESWEDRVRDALADLGFSVENRKVPLEVTVVDRCERPNEN